MREYDFHTYSVRAKRSNKKYIFFVGIIAIFCLFTSLFIGLRQQKKPLSVAKATYLAEALVQPQNPLEGVVTDSLNGVQGSYSVVIINKKKNQSYALNEHQIYDSASLYKLWIMAVAFEQIQSGKLDPNTVLQGDVKALNKKFHISPDSADLTDGEVSLTVASALKQMITISHNYSALLLTDKVGVDQVKKFLTDNGLHESIVGVNNHAPTTTAHDIGLFLQELEQGTLANQTYTQQMFDLLKQQKLNNKLPLYLPQNVVVAHKTGELGQYSHDAGFVYLPDSDYIIVVMTKSNYPPAAEDHIGHLSQAVYDYFLNH